MVFVCPVSALTLTATLIAHHCRPSSRSTGREKRAAWEFRDTLCFINQREKIKEKEKNPVAVLNLK